MIIGNDVHPERKIYYWGSIVLEILGSKKEKDISSFLVYEELKSANEISAEIYLLTLDWLFMLGAIEGKNGLIKKCF